MIQFRLNDFDELWHLKNLKEKKNHHFADFTRKKKWIYFNKTADHFQLLVFVLKYTDEDWGKFQWRKKIGQITILKLKWQEWSWSIIWLHLHLLGEIREGVFCFFHFDFNLKISTLI